MGIVSSLLGGELGQSCGYRRYALPGQHRMKFPNPFRLPKRQPTVRIEFTCAACGHVFEQNVRRLYVDLAVSRLKQDREGGFDIPGELRIPDPIVCPKCQAVDKFEISPAIYGVVSGALLRNALGGGPDPDDPIQFFNLTPTDPAQPGASSRPHSRRRKRK
jgi:rubredoxin